MKTYTLTLCLFLVSLMNLQVSAKNPFPKMDKEITTFMEDGGWCWYQDPRSIIHNDQLIIGGISGVSGDIRVAVFDLKTNTPLGVTILHKGLDRDDHNAPAFYVRPDGSLLAVWAKHGKEKIHYYSISSPTDYLSWSERKLYTHDSDVQEEPSWKGVTYMNLYTIESQGLLYNFHRNGITYNPTFVTSSDNGDTWGNKTHFIADEVEGRQRPYARYMQVNNNTVGISFTDGHPRNYGNSLYYANFDGTSYYNVDGTKIKDVTDGPLRTSEAEKIFVGSETKEKPLKIGSVPNAAWTCEIEKDKKENPHIGYTLYKTPNDIRFRLANWTGKAWNDREIAFAGNGLYPKEDNYTGLLALDPEDPTNVMISTDVDPNTGEDKSGKHEIYVGRVKKPDHTETIEWTALTSDSKERNIRPIIVSGEGYKVALWLSGPWRTYTDFESDIVGQVLERPKKQK